MNTNIEVLRELDELVEAARLLGMTQAKKLFGEHTEGDRRFERAMYESIDKHRAALLDWEAKQPAPQQTASVDEVKETDLWRCTVCGRVGTVGRCCGEETRERANLESLQAEIEALRAEVDALRKALAELITWIPSADTYRRLGFDPATPMQALMEAKTVLRREGKQ